MKHDDKRHSLQAREKKKLLQFLHPFESERRTMTHIRISDVSVSNIVYVLLLLQPTALT